MKDVQTSTLNIEMKFPEHEKLRLLLKHLGITRPEIADLTGFSIVSISNYLSGKHAKRSKVPDEIKNFLSLPQAEQDAKLQVARLKLNP